MTPLLLLSAVIAAQIVVFQWLAVRWVPALLSLRLGLISPPPAVRTASLTPRRLSRYYPPALETLPPLVFAGTVVYTWAAGQSAAEAPWLAPVSQIAFLVGGWLAARHALRTAPLLSQSTRAAIADSGRAIEVEEAIRRVKLRALLAVRICIQILFAAMQVRRLHAPGGGLSWPALTVWLLVAAMLGVFAGATVRLMRVRRALAP